MWLISRYVSRYFLNFFFGGLAACAAVLLLVDLFEQLDKFIGRDVLWRDAAQYLLLKLPWMVYQMVPAACLLASVLTFSTLNKHQETIAIRAQGISPLRLTRPLLVLGGVACLSLLCAQEYVLPYTNQAYNLILRTRIQRVKIDPHLGLYKKGQIWYRSAERLWSAQSSEPLAQRLLGVTVYELDAAGTVRQRFDAAEARYDGQTWLFLQGSRRAFGPDGLFDGLPETFTELRLAFPENPQAISRVRKTPEEMGLREIYARAVELQRQGRPEPLYRVELHGKLAYAVLCIIMAGFGMPLALHMNRHGGTMLALSLTLLCGFGYVILHNFILALGHNGQLPPAVAAWAANGLFGAGSLLLARRLQ
ncbi:MAG: LPS export ABC transporter permease LptG [Candidatus Tectimicrobiota bacterium]